jgi:hypothetical protein
VSATDPRAAALAGALENVDRPAVAAALDALAVELGGWDTSLRNAAVYPAVLATAVLVSGAVVGAMGLPALAMLPGGAAVPLWPAAVGVGVSAGSLFLLAGLVRRGARVPALARGWNRLDGFALLASTRILPAALRASATWCAQPETAIGLARALESADPSPRVAGLLDAFEAALLLGAARGGVEGATLEALTEARRTALGREIPAEAERLELLSLLLAGVGIASVGGAWMWAYSLGVSR